MSEYIETAKQYISEGNEEEALKLARKRHGKDDAESYIAILDLLIENGNLAALEEKGMYYQYYDPAHDDGDYGVPIGLYSGSSQHRDGLHDPESSSANTENEYFICHNYLPILRNLYAFVLRNGALHTRRAAMK